MKLFSTEHTYKHSWSNVTLAFWRKYPNSKADHVKEVDTYHRTIDEQGNLISHRLIACESALPSWISALGVDNRAYAVEQTICNAKEKKMIVRSRNVSGSSVLVLEETCAYHVHPDNPKWTLYKQEAKVTSFLPFVYNKLENYTFASVAQRSQQGLEVMESICQAIAKGGIKSAFPTLFQNNTSTTSTPATSTL